MRIMCKIKFTLPRLQSYIMWKRTQGLPYIGKCFRDVLVIFCVLPVRCPIKSSLSSKLPFQQAFPASTNVTWPFIIEANQVVSVCAKLFVTHITLKGLREHHLSQLLGRLLINEKRKHSLQRSLFPGLCFRQWCVDDRRSWHQSARSSNPALPLRTHTTRLSST